MRQSDTFRNNYKHTGKFRLLALLVFIGCGRFFTRLYDPELLPTLTKITRSFIVGTFSNLAYTGRLSLDVEALGTIGQTFLTVLPLMLIGIGAAGIPFWIAFCTADLIRDTWDTAKIEYDRRKTISNNPELDRDKVNATGREMYLSYDNELLRLYAGPDKKGRLIVPEGIESIGPDAFERFVTEKDSDIGPRIRKGIASIVLPGSIRNLNPYNIPRNSTLELIDVTQKIRLDDIRSFLKGRNICVQGGLFTDLLCDCQTSTNTLSQKSQVLKLPTMLVERFKKTLRSINDQTLKERILDGLHKQVLCGNINLADFCVVLYSSDFKDQERYKGPDVINRLYGSKQDAIEQYAESYYEAEKARVAEAALIRKKGRRNDNKRKAVEEIEDFLRIVETFE